MLRSFQQRLTFLASYRTPDGRRLGLRTAATWMMILDSSSGPLTLGEIAETLGITRTAATGIVDQLVALGWVHREHEDEDRRRVLASATKAGFDDMLLKGIFRRPKP